MHILLIDNNDSFTRNLEHLLATAIAGAMVVVEPYSRLAELDLTAPDCIVISPGPGVPADYPGYERVFEADKPVLGICLGMQIMNEYRGGSTGRLPGCVHGKTDTIFWNDSQRTVARYHSLCVTQVGDGLTILAENSNSVPMSLGSAHGRMLGYQFHPESFLTPDGGAFIHDALSFLNLR
ncbi:aminodeoxychorismate/anthranilate synthase component II [Pseudodesulfovibrio sp.]|nr:aminodeoxychorismate/anthranilate synthase component II [Pseudodesulfovibrio sp.]